MAHTGQFSKHRMEAAMDGRGLWVERGDWSLRVRRREGQRAFGLGRQQSKE